MKNIIYAITFLMIVTCFNLSAQEANQNLPIPDTYRKASIGDQLNQLEAHTKIYQNFRAIREDIFQLVSKNVRDSLAGSNKKIVSLNAEIKSLNARIDSINKGHSATKSELEEMTMRQNSIKVLGLYINKTVYNTIMWSIIAIAILLLLIGYFIFKKNRETTVKAKTDLVSLEKEYEDYKQKKRLEIENMTMVHFTEMKKLRDSYKS